MRTQLLGLTAASAALLLGAPAAAAPHWSSPGQAAAGVGVTVHRGGPPPGGLLVDDGGRDGDHDGGSDHRRGRDRLGRGIIYYDSGAWAYYNNRTFESDSYNDWWHDRPDRAYPRWIQTNQNCERQWWSGGVWRC